VITGTIRLHQRNAANIKGAHHTSTQLRLWITGSDAHLMLIEMVKTATNVMSGQQQSMIMNDCVYEMDHAVDDVTSFLKWMMFLRVLSYKW
jgi:hypothetical protein